MTSIELNELYLKLKEKEVNLDLLGEADNFRTLAKDSNNDEYYLKAINLILDIFTQADDNSLLDDALRLGLDNYELARSYSDKFNDMYKEYLQKLSYIYITKQLYKQALAIENEYKDYINPENKDEVNRWQLELAYIYNAIDEKNEALRKFQAILLNNPKDEIKSVCLSNISQLYIEANDLVNAKKTLEENYSFAKAINDEEGIRYITCLKGKILRLQNDYKNSYNTIYPLIMDIKEINIENLYYLNEFLNLLIDMERFSEGLELASKYFEEVNDSLDLEDKLLFYKNTLRLEIEQNTKKHRGSIFNSTLLLDKINKLEKEIEKNKEINSSKLRESELDLDALNKERSLTNKIKDNLLQINNLNNESLRDFMMSYGDNLSSVIPMDEVVLVLFDKTLNQKLALYPLKEELITTYDYKQSRLYERKLSYDKIDKTIIFDVFNENKVINLDYTKNNYAYINPFTNDFYANEKYKYISCYPLNNNDSLFGVIIYLSKSNNILDYYNNAIIEIETSLFKSNLMNMLYVENNKLEHSLYKEITNVQDFGVFYYSDINKNYILSDALKALLKTTKSELSSDNFNDYVLKSDLTNYKRKYDYIAGNKNYNITYHLVIDSKEVLVSEKAFAKNIDSNLYYVGTISKIDLERDAIKAIKDEVLDINSLNEELERLKDNKFNALVISAKFDYRYYKELKDAFEERVYFNNDIYYLLTNLKTKDLLTKIKINKELFKNINYSIIEYPNPLIRLDDLVGASEYVLSIATTPYTVFTNEIYATFISIRTIDTMVSRGIVDGKISLLSQTVTLDSQFVGYFITPNIPGVYDLNNLKVVSKSTLSTLDKYMVKKLNDEENISIYSLSLESLANILNNDILNKQSKIIFKINNFNDESLVNDVIKKLSDTKCRLIINYNLLLNVSIENIMYHNDIIMAFDQELTEEERGNVRKLTNNDYYIFDNPNSLKVSKVVNKK